MPATNKCPQCGASVDPNSGSCRYCGEVLAQQPVRQPYVPQPYGQQPVYQPPTTPYDPSWPIKSKVAAGLLGIFLGGIGVHKFYLGKVGMGVLYLLLSWTFVPAFVGFIEGVIYLTSSDHNFQIKHRVRLQ